MCPICSATAALLIAGATPMGGVIAITLKKFAPLAVRSIAAQGFSSRNKQEDENGVNQKEGSARSAA